MSGGREGGAGGGVGAWGWAGGAGAPDERPRSRLHDSIRRLRGVPPERRGACWEGGACCEGGAASKAPRSSAVAPINGATVDGGAAPAPADAGSAGVIVGAAGAEVEIGAEVSLNRTEAGAPGAAAGSSVVASGLTASSRLAGEGGGASETAGTGCDAGGICWAESARPLRSRPHDWQLVCPRKTSVAPQNRHVGFCDPCPTVTLNLSSGRALRHQAPVACQYDLARRPEDRRFGLARRPPGLASASADRPPERVPPGVSSTARSDRRRRS